MHAVPENDPVNASRVAGNNFALRRSSLHADEFSGEGIIEHEMIARIAATEQVARLDPEMIVTYAFPDPAGARLITRFRHGRLYAGRAVRLGGESRLIGFAKTPLLPFVLSFRAMMAMASEVSLLKHWRVIPAVIFQQIAWSIGESAGYLGGEGKIEESWV
jgi:hypothetical protein